jgi:hypothetical protein
MGINTQGGWGGRYNMNISQLQIYNRALSATEIQQNYYANFYQYTNNLQNRVKSDNGVFEDYNNNTTKALSDINILDKASWALTPTAYKEDKLYAIVPNDGSGDLTVTRATTGTRVNSESYVEIVPYNLLSYSEEFDNNIKWGKTQVTVSPNSIISPNETLTSDKIIPTSTLSIHIISQLVSVLGLYTYSVYAKGGEYNFLRINCRQSSNAYMNVDLSTGVISSFGGTNYVDSSIYNVGNGWYRLSLTVNLTTSTSTFNNAIENPLGSVQFSGDGVSGLYLWGAQLVEGTDPKPYLPTLDRLDIPRITYPISGGTPSLLIEPQRTNLLLYSEQFDNSFWVKDALVLGVWVNQFTAPNGTISAEKLIPDSTNARHRVRNEDYNSKPAGTYTISAFFKSSGVTRGIIGYEIAGTNRYTAEFDLSTGEFTRELTFISPPTTTFNYELFNDGWIRAYLTFTTPTDGYIASWFGCSSPVTSNFGGVFGYLGNSVDAMYLWGTQLERGTYPTSYIPTTNATVTRNADVVAKTNISDLIGQTEGTLFVDFNYEKNDPNDNFIAILSDNSSNNGVWLDINPSSAFVAIIRANGSSSVNFSLSAANFQFGRKKIAFSYKSGATDLYINGVKISVTNTNSFTFNNTVSKFNLGCFWNNSSQLNNTINSSTIFKQALTNAECISLTTL